MIRGAGPEARSKDGGPVVSDADRGPTVRGGPFQRLIGAGAVVELALLVVVHHEQAQGRVVGVVGELQHRDVAVGVARGEDGPAARAVPDAYGLLGTVVEVVGFGLVGDGPAVDAAGVGER